MDPAPRRRRSLRLLARAACGLAAMAALVFVALAPGCGLDAIDSKTNRLVAQAAQAIGSPVSPHREYTSLDSYNKRGQTSKSVETENPSAADMTYPTAQEDLGVAERLEAFERYGAIDEKSAIKIDLPAAFAIAQRTAREYLDQEEEFILASIRVLIERHRWSPRFFDTLSATFNGDLRTGGETAVRIVNELRATQRLPYGGDLEARLVWDATDQLRQAVGASNADFDQRATVTLVANLPLLRNAGLIAQEDLIQAERNLIYSARDFERFRRTFLVAIARDFLGLVAQVQQIENQKRSITSRERSLARTAAQVIAGRERPSARNQIGQSLDQARATLINITESYLVRLDQFKIRLGIPVTRDVEIITSGLNLPESGVSPAQAAETAIKNRLDLQNRRDQIDDARRSVSNSRNQVLPDLDINAQANFRTSPGNQNAGFELTKNASDWMSSVTFGLPLDREIERLNLRSSILSLNRQIRNYDQFRDQVILDARSARRRIDQQRVSLDLAIGNIHVNSLTLEEFEIRTDVNPFNLTDAEDALLRSENDRDSRERDLQIAILEYLLATGQMRVNRDGALDPLKGMPGFQESPAAPADAPQSAPDEAQNPPDADPVLPNAPPPPPSADPAAPDGE